MKVQLQSQTVLILAVMAVAGVGGWLLYRKAAALVPVIGEGLQDGAWAVTPWNNDNIIYGGVNSAGSAITGDSHFTLGGWIYDMTHPDPMKQNEPPRQHGATGSW